MDKTFDIACMQARYKDRFRRVVCYDAASLCAAVAFIVLFKFFIAPGGSMADFGLLEWTALGIVFFFISYDVCFLLWVRHCWKHRRDGQDDGSVISVVVEYRSVLYLLCKGILYLVFICTIGLYGAPFFFIAIHVALLISKISLVRKQRLSGGSTAVNA